MDFVLESLILEAIRATEAPIRKIRRRRRKLATQIEDAAESMGLNFYEGNWATKGNRTKAFSISRQETNEARGGLLIAEAKGLVTRADIEEAVERQERVSKMLWSLIR